MYDLEFDMSENGDRGEGCKGVETHTHRPVLFSQRSVTLELHC